MGFLDSIKKAFSGNKDSEEYLNGFSKTNANLGRRLRYIYPDGKVEVVDVQTLNMPVKKKRVGRYSGLSNRCKKAIVTLKAGQTIDLK